MTAALDRILFAIVLRVVLAVDALRDCTAWIEAHLPAWAQDQDNRLLAYLLVSSVVCVVAVVVQP